MSFILDALRKAEVDRDRGRGSDLGGLPAASSPLPSARPVPPQVGPGSQVRAVAKGGRWGIIAAAVAACVLGAVAGAWWMRPVVTQAQDDGLPRRSAPRNDPPLEAPAPSLRGPQGPTQSSSSPAPSLRDPQGPTQSSSAPSPSLRDPQGSKQSSSASANPPQPWPHSQLPPEAQRTLATWQVNGSMHSPQRSARMLIINGQVVREGDSPAAGIKILEIRPRSVVLGVQDQTYEWPLPTP
jgi:general secretion pathway protein B